MRILVNSQDRGNPSEVRSGPQKASRRRRTRYEEEISRFYEAYRETRRTLQRKIKIAKARSWMELIESVESDP